MKNLCETFRVDDEAAFEGCVVVGRREREGRTDGGRDERREGVREEGRRGEEGGGGGREEEGLRGEEGGGRGKEGLKGVE